LYIDETLENLWDPTNNKIIIKGGFWKPIWDYEDP
jgi:hypothetical protein